MSSNKVVGSEYNSRIQPWLLLFDIAVNRSMVSQMRIAGMSLTLTAAR